MKISGNAIRPGMIIEHQGRLWRAVKIMHTQPGKGGAYLQVELKDIRDGTKLNERFRSAETVERVRLDQSDYQYLFDDGDPYTFMDTETYEQVALHKDMLGEDRPVPAGDMSVTIEATRTAPISVAAARPGDLADRRGRSRRQGPDCGIILQAGAAGERRPRDGAAARRIRHAGRHRHRRRRATSNAPRTDPATSPSGPADPWRSARRSST